MVHRGHRGGGVILYPPHENSANTSAGEICSRSGVILLRCTTVRVRGHTLKKAYNLEWPSKSNIRIIDKNRRGSEVGHVYWSLYLTNTSY